MTTEEARKRFESATKLLGQEVHAEQQHFPTGTWLLANDDGTVIYLTAMRSNHRDARLLAARWQGLAFDLVDLGGAFDQLPHDGSYHIHLRIDLRMVAIDDVGGDVAAQLAKAAA